MKLVESVRLPAAVQTAYDAQLQQALTPVLSATARKVNAMADGRIAGLDGVASAAPTAGTWQRGDIVRNEAPAELGGAGAKYVVLGWICVVAGTPGTWREMRTLTGN